jgi:hypothetical protein
VNSKEFKLACISKNTNSFGLHNHIFISLDGEAWEACGYRGSGGRAECIQLYDIVKVSFHNGKAEWCGFEIPNRLPDAPLGVIKEVWG